MKMVAETHHHLSTAGTLALIIPLGLVSFALLGVLVKMFWDEREPKPTKDRERLNELRDEVREAANKIHFIEVELGRRDFVKFKPREQLEAIALNRDLPCPACGHRRTKDG